ncbi:MAG TPA: hypothetical protein VJZ26_16655 [Blastocatellia bacterium]|nr:hypothetical protein [Blastocatellia bacterium]
MKTRARMRKAEGGRQKAEANLEAPLVFLPPSLNRGFARMLTLVLLLTAYCLLPTAFRFQPSVGAQAQQAVDQILTLVNQDIITRSDLLWSIALDSKAPNPAGNVSSDVLHRKLDVMIDQRLIEQEARRIPGSQITQDEINKKRTELINLFGSESVFRPRVEAVGLTPQKIDELIRDMIRVERFIDFRFRSFVFVTEQEINKYYDERFAPEIRRQGQVPPPLDATLNNRVTVRESINSILKQEKINQEIDAWLKATRERADITHLAEP